MRSCADNAAQHRSLLNVMSARVHPMSSLRLILDAIKTAKPRRSLAIFDLDSTLYDLTLRVTAILDQFANSPDACERYPDLCQKLAKIEIRRTDWGLTEPLERIGISKKTHPEFVEEVQAAWARGFFSNDFLDRDFPLPGAVQFVEQCLKLGADVLYLTGRDTKRMGSGTEKSLRESGFPIDDLRARLHLKPDASLDDAEFKADVIEDLVSKYDLVWLFENEPVNINAVVRRTPQVKIVFIDTCHSGAEEVRNAIATVQHFEISISDLES